MKASIASTVGVLGIVLLSDQEGLVNSVRINTSSQFNNNNEETELVEVDNSVTIWKADNSKVKVVKDKMPRGFIPKKKKEKVKQTPDDPDEAWTGNRIQACNETSWVASAPKGYKVEPLAIKAKEGSGQEERPHSKKMENMLQTGYDHWTEERLGNSSETDWVANSPMRAYGGYLQTGYDHWTNERLGNSSETDWVANSPMEAYGANFLQRGYNHWTEERLGNSSETDWVANSPMESYGAGFLQTGYNHWTDERLGNSSETDWVANSPMEAYGAGFLQTGYNHWTDERLGNSSETDWVASSPMEAYGASFLQTGYDHWTFDRLGNSSETDWVANSPMEAYGS